MFFLRLLLCLFLGLTAKTPVGTAAVEVTFTDIARQAGINFTNVFGGAKAKRYLLESTGSGVAWIDYDRDGYPDLFLVNGTTIEGFPAAQAPSNHLFHNNRDGTFTDVTAKAGLAHSGWGQGVCVGDYDNDGWDDIFVTYYGKNLLYHNNGDGAFTEVAEKAGVAGDPARWNTGCVSVAAVPVPLRHLAAVGTEPPHVGQPRGRARAAEERAAMEHRVRLHRLRSRRTA